MDHFVTARLKRRNKHAFNRYYNIICGANRANGPCPESLGRAMQAILMPKFQIPYGASNLKPEDWYAKGEPGYRVDDDGKYHVLTPQRPQPRRSLPKQIQDAVLPPSLRQGTDDDPVYLIVGETPILPSYIYCPKCGNLNFVPSPNDD